MPRKRVLKSAPQLQEVLELNRALARYIEAPKDDVRERELEVENAELRQRNEAMLRELERRRLQAEGKGHSRPWWRFW